MISTQHPRHSSVGRRISKYGRSSHVHYLLKRQRCARLQTPQTLWASNRVLYSALQRSELASAAGSRAVGSLAQLHTALQSSQPASAAGTRAAGTLPVGSRAVGNLVQLQRQSCLAFPCSSSWQAPQTPCAGNRMPYLTLWCHFRAAGSLGQPRRQSCLTIQSP
jgi:hypothetical protein